MQHLRNEELFKENLDLCEECLSLISNSLARRTWQKYGSALSLWQKFANDKNVKGFPALAFLCWCRKNTTVKSTTVKGYLSALRKIKFLLGFRSKKGERTIEKIILRGMENIECRNEKQPKKNNSYGLKNHEPYKKWPAENRSKKLYKEKCMDKNMPVFLRSSGGSLTKTTFLKNTNCALKKEDPNAGNLQGKSFRSGIPTLLKKSEPENMEKNLKILGRWKSSAYRCYIRNLDPGNHPGFLQTAETLLTNFFAQERNPGSESM